MAPINPGPIQMMLGVGSGGPPFDNRPPGPLAPGGPIGGSDGAGAPVPPPSNVPPPRAPGPPPGKFTWMFQQANFCCWYCIFMLMTKTFLLTRTDCPVF